MTRFRSFVIISMSLVLLSMTVLKIELELMSLFDEKIELKIPKDFEIMSEEMMKIKYPADQRPTLVYTNESGSVNVALNWTESRANQDLIVPYTDNFVQIFQNMYPSADWKESGTTNINGMKVGYLELVTPAIDTEIYNLMFFTNLEHRLLLCTFNCTKKDLKEWKSSAKEIMNSLKIR